MESAPTIAKRVFVERSAKTGLIIAKTCTVCDEYKELEDFAIDKKGFAGYAATCKVCTKAIKDRWASVGRADLEALYAEGLSEEEIAERFEVSVGSVATRRNQCRIPNPNPKVISLTERRPRPW